jgi:hypothetical protein
MPIIQAPPTCVPVTHRAAALARGDGESRLSVPLASAGPQPGDLKRTVIEAIRVRQRHHLAYDAKHHKNTAYRTRKAAMQTADLFEA